MAHLHSIVAGPGLFLSIGCPGRPDRHHQGPPAHPVQGQPATARCGHSWQARPGRLHPAPRGAQILPLWPGAATSVPSVRLRCSSAHQDQGRRLTRCSGYGPPGFPRNTPPPPELPLRSAGPPHLLQSDSTTAGSPGAVSAAIFRPLIRLRSFTGSLPPPHGTSLAADFPAG
ncbi:hypothetical protein NDU88_009599 [Pleurodeles waltl]|uniref:Uncharacterized protein n=1 Tax=Pleurodeles waltl TaxID=8319 RepID=A0AAV7QU33_PLEWA|nr:hypothetical protein NDU88_009599 [Pleurodeles waltl]